MSYDLFFYRRSDTLFDIEKARAYLNAHFQTDEPEASSWTYHNEDTGVYFTIELQPEDMVDEDEMNTSPDFTSVNFSCSINYIRPSYFGLEAFPVIEQIAEDLDLYLLNPQDETAPDTPPEIS